MQAKREQVLVGLFVLVAVGYIVCGRIYHERGRWKIHHKISRVFSFRWRAGTWSDRALRGRA